MKNILTISLLITAFGVNAQIVNIPDANFKFQLVNTLCVDADLDQIPESDADLNNDGEIQVSEAEAITGGLLVPWGFIDPVEDKIDDLTGIESFANIQLLSIFGNNILGELDLTPLTELRTVYADDNNLNSLIFGNNPELTVVYCSGNNLSVLDVTGAPALTDLGAIDNWLETLDLSQNLSLVDVRVEDNFLTDVTLPATDTFTTLYIGQNRLEQIDLSPASNLRVFWAYDNRFETFDPSVSPTLETISLADNDELISVDFSQNVNLIELDVRFNDGLRTFNLQNGNNENMEYMLATSNVSLECVVVDDVDATRPPCSGSFDGWCLGSLVVLTEDECILSIEDNDLLELAVFPNPTASELNVESSLPVDSIAIYSLQGILVQKSSQSMIDVSNLPAGIYFAEIQVDGNVMTKKFIKE